NAVSTTLPDIAGGDYGIYSGTVKYYDGVLRGGIEAYQDGAITSIADNATIQFSTSSGYHIVYLAEEHFVVKNGETKYTKLSDAISESEVGDTIELIDDNYLFYTLSVPSEKELSILTNGFSIHTGNPIVNSGKITITNNTPTAQTIEYIRGDYFITNNADAELTLNNININAAYGINNSGKTTLANVSVASSNAAIKNTGNFLANNAILSGDSYPIYNDTGESNLTNTSFVGEYTYNNSGTLKITGGSASKTNTASNIGDYFTNKGTMELDSTQITLTNTNPTYNYSYDHNHYRALYNSGSLVLNNGTTISHIIDAPNSTITKQSSTVHNDGGAVIIASSSIIYTATNTRNYSYDSRAIYSPTGTVAIESGTVSATGIGRAYGIYTDSGTIIIGTPEPPDSPNYGRDTADVSTTSPDISAISTSTSNSYKLGVGVKNASGGRVEYYDGKVSGNTSAFAEEPTATEHFYEVCTELDTTTTPNLYTAKLFWMRDGQSTCANN
ncbi:hypothetical protein IK110_02715, partial [Candidatus Saccharibacteria bacterium]|nr:hypothetical protein [Candidatus Saccharibacteria bacterium]